MNWLVSLLGGSEIIFIVVVGRYESFSFQRKSRSVRYFGWTELTTIRYYMSIYTKTYHIGLTTLIPIN